LYAKYIVRVREAMQKRIVQDAVISETMHSLRRIIKSLQDYSQEVFSHFGVTGPQLWALKTIHQAGSLSLGELSKEMYLNPSTISGVVDRLEKKGYVVRDRTEKDRRVVKVRLTPEGEILVKKAPNPVQGKMIYGLRKLRREELSLIYESVQKLVEIMEAQDLKVTFFFEEEGGSRGSQDSIRRTARP
jgi:MarR family transcriptional regulator, organic hydroperoxide resistance regulator